MLTIVILICSLVIVLGFEIRHRMVAEQLTILDNEVHRLNQEILRLGDTVKKKQDIYHEYKPPAL